MRVGGGKLVLGNCKVCFRGVDRMDLWGLPT
jgi:hypothetical protein